MEVTNRYIAVKTQIDGAPKESDFEVKSSSLSMRLDAISTDTIVKNICVSIDPYQVNRIKSSNSSHSASHFSVAISPGEGFDAFGVGKVVVSGNPEYEEGDLVVGLLSWAEYTVVKQVGAILRKFDPLGFPLSYHIGILGMSGLTAYAGFFEICKPKKGEKVLVSAASGSVGNLVGQYAKLFGCYVVGSTGSKEKVALLKEKLGFDDAFNYKEETDLDATLKSYFPDGIDIYFDNVGAEMQEAAVCNMKTFGRVAVCGIISEYTQAGKRAAPSMIDVVYKRIKMQGFLAADHMDVYPDFLRATCDHLRSGEIHPLEDISDGLETIPSAFVGLFRGDNVGKKIVRIVQE